MVRKPDLVPVPLSQAMHNPPYPTTPPDEHPPPLSSPYDASAYQFVSHEDARPTRSRSNSSADEPSDWEAYSDSEDDVPPPLKVGAGKRQSSIAANKDATLPAPLRVGPPSGSPVPRISVEDEDRPNIPEVKTPEPDAKKDEPPKIDESPKKTESPSSQRRPTIPLQSQNPYLRLQTTGQSSDGEERQPFWEGSAASAVQQEPVEMPLDNSTPVEALSKMSLGEQKPAKQEPQFVAPSAAQEQGEGRQNDSPSPEAVKQVDSTEAAAPVQARADPEVHLPSVKPPMGEQEEPPALPPRRAQDEEMPPPKPRRPQEAMPNAETPTSQQSRQRREHYSIRHIRWFDSRTNSLRHAPVLTQNANGPCPLLALVNALILNAREGQQTPLMETLGNKETVSLGLLLDAVFEELMSGPNSAAAQSLPDVGDLYAFLLALHTGMNVNPRFVEADTPSLIDHPILEASASPGDFEQTREMRLYSTFGVPLIHGWLPPRDSRAYAAFDRVAKTYEDAQNVQFHEEELEAKLTSSGLSEEERALYEDLSAIKEFLFRYPTQLTEHGLGVMRNTMKPGQIAILFRNDHFSTVYKQPGTGRILSLVTDAGYSNHEEIVWESLVDVNGSGSELFSGDFRPVSQGQQAERPIRSLLDDIPATDDGNWQTVQPRKRQTGGAGNVQTGASVTSPQESGTLNSTGQAKNSRTEQEDADLALALQLQEEEEDRHRRETEARRRRENELSQSFLGNEASRNNQRSTSNPNPNPTRIMDTIRNNDIRPLIPPRRSGPQQAQTTHRPADDGDEAPPPTYEQAQNSPVYNPASGLPNPPNNPAAARHGRGQSAYASTSQSYYIGGEGRGSARGRGAAMAARGRGRRQTTGAGTGPGGRLIDRIPDGHGTGAQAGEVGEGKDKCCVM
ncbi:hypothetical protein HDK90DRAFT_20253 [Phyllosticta capitalensis]|uniref:MINDY deubiquitinase domain-containing protein n=1 Tax=Phyllosticta capitalensis TaxID=121624 RepID=A0ABR1Z303_9PEZI